MHQTSRTVSRVTSEPPSPRLLRREIPGGPGRIVLQCLAETPVRRPASYAELADLLRPFSTTADAGPLRPRFMAGVIDMLRRRRDCARLAHRDA